jgi:anti-sigma regulatory factor (Ser/Thr protein kinase)
MSHPEQRFPPTPASVEQARAFVRATIADLAVDNVCVVLMVDELAANAVIHARSSFTVRVVADVSTVRVEVEDDSPELPMLSTPDPLAAGGRGMLIVDRCATAWGVKRHPDDGKTVWFESSHLAV